MTNITSNNIAVTAVGGGIGQSVLRALRLSSLKLRIVGFDVNPWGTGLFTSSHGFTVPSSSDTAFMKQLIEKLRQEEAEVLIVGSDPEVTVISRAQEDFLYSGIFPLVGSPNAVELCRNKLAGYKFFNGYGLPFAKTASASEAAVLADMIGFPLIVKPARGSASRGVTIAFNKDQLEQQLAGGDKIVQEYLVPKSWKRKQHELTFQDVYENGILKQTDEISIQMLFDHEGNFLGKFTSCNVLRDGVPMLINPMTVPQAEEIALKMASLLTEQGLIGPCNLQCKMTKRGPIFFEVNPRFTGITAARAAMGFNEIEAVLRRLLFNEPLDEVKKRLRVPQDLVCSRYITEAIIPREDLEMLKKRGSVQGHADRTTL